MGSVKSDFVIRDRRVLTDNLTVSVGKTPVVMTGWTDFDRRLDYRIQVDRLTQRLPPKAREVLADLEIDLKNLSHPECPGHPRRTWKSPSTSAPWPGGEGSPRTPTAASTTAAGSRN